MKVVLLKDVYNLGRAGDVKKVADRYDCLRTYLDSIWDYAACPAEYQLQCRQDLQYVYDLLSRRRQRYE